MTEIKTKACNYCKENINKDAEVCPKCHKDLRSWFIRHWFLSILLTFFVYYIGNMMFLYNEWTQTLHKVNGELTSEQTWDDYYYSH